MLRSGVVDPMYWILLGVAAIIVVMYALEKAYRRGLAHGRAMAEGRSPFRH